MYISDIFCFIGNLWFNMTPMKAILFWWGLLHWEAQCLMFSWNSLCFSFHRSSKSFEDSTCSSMFWLYVCWSKTKGGLHQPTRASPGSASVLPESLQEVEELGLRGRGVARFFWLRKLSSSLQGVLVKPLARYGFGVGSCPGGGCQIASSQSRSIAPRTRGTSCARGRTLSMWTPSGDSSLGQGRKGIASEREKFFVVGIIMIYNVTYVCSLLGFLPKSVLFYPKMFFCCGRRPWRPFRRG